MTPASTRHLGLAALLVSSGALAGGLPATELEDITVTGGTPRTNAIAASDGVVLEPQLSLRPITRIAELLEFVPGMIATQHSGEGKANQYYLRGFNLDHGTDFAAYVDNMPVNLPSHGHGQGYLDLNFIIPEMVSELAYRKGPYHADSGDFATAGSARFVLRDDLPNTLLSLEGGQDDYQRGLAAGAMSLGPGRLLLAGELSRYAGPWVLDQDLDAARLFARFSQGGSDGRLRLTLMGYDSQWTATDQVPLRAVRSGQISRLGFIDPTVGGDSRRYSLSADWHSERENGHWQASAYAIDYQLQLYSNFTYFLEDPDNGDQFEQLDERRVYGLNSQRQWPVTLGTMPGEISLGAELRHDAIADIGLFRTRQRQRLDTVRRDRIDQTSAGLYAQLALSPAPRWRIVTALRGDAYRFEVDSDLDANSGRRNEQMLSPKLNIGFAASDTLSLFLNLARGFHSNDARGTVIRIDPSSDTGEAAGRVDPLVAADAVDLGLVLRPARGLSLSASLWALELDSELVFVGDGGSTEASDASRRYGVELSGYYAPRPGLIVDADYTWTRARFDADPGARHIPNAVEQVASLGLSYQPAERWSLSLRGRYLGAAPLIEDNSVRSDPTLVTNLEIAHAPHPALNLRLGLYNLFDSRDADITYFYASRLPGEPEDGIEDRHFHPVEPRQLRLAATLRW